MDSFNTQSVIDFTSTDIRNESFKEKLASGEIAGENKIVFESIKMFNESGRFPTSLEIADVSGILFTNVRRSVSNLLKSNLINVAGKKLERYGKNNTTYKLNNYKSNKKYE